MPSDWVLRFRDVTASLSGRASKEKETVLGAVFDERLQDALSLIDHGEPGVALENLSQNIFEYEIPITADEYSRLAEAGTSMHLDPGTWSFLAGLIR